MFQKVTEPIVGDIRSLFQWLSTYCNFNDASTPKAQESIAEVVHSIHTLEKECPVDHGIEVTQRYRRSLDETKRDGLVTGDLEGDAGLDMDAKEHQASSSLKNSGHG